jgi:hypothetical protein
LYAHHKCLLNYIWNSNEINIQVGRQYGAQILARGGSREVYNTIPRSQEWMTMDCVMNATFSIIERKKDREVLATLVKEREKKTLKTPTLMLMKDNK